MELRFQTFPILPQLNGLIEKIWQFESPGKLPGNDLKLIVPNGRPLLLLPYHNGMLSEMGGREFTAAENRIGLIGTSDQPSIVDSLTDAPTACIGIEFSPLAFYRFFHIHLGQISNEFNLLTSISGKQAAVLEARLSGIASPAEKISRLQQYLLHLLYKKDEDALFEHCIWRIEQTAGSISIKELERVTGYTSRWLNTRFNEKLGLSAKNFSSIIRFQHFYRAIILETAQFKIKRPWYYQYYDQSHFIRDFKRFTGMSPTKLIAVENKFGKMFY